MTPGVTISVKCRSKYVVDRVVGEVPCTMSDLVRREVINVTVLNTLSFITPFREILLGSYLNKTVSLRVYL